MPGPRHSEETRQRVLDLAREGVTRNDIHRQTGVAAGVISRWCQLAGVSFDRSATIAATAAVQADNRAKRVLMSTRLLDITSQRLDLLDEPYVAFSFGGKNNTYEEHHFDKPPAEAALKIVQSASVAIGRHIDLDKVDTDGGTAVVKSMLAGLAAGLGVAADG